MGCRGCYGPLDGIEDQGIKMLSAISSGMRAGKPGEPEHEIHRQVNEAVKTLADPAGTFYRFGMSRSTLFRSRIQGNNTNGKGAA
jgi:F420-non-reducing hydrogenase small subunit